MKKLALLMLLPLTTQISYGFENLMGDALKSALILGAGAGTIATIAIIATNKAMTPSQTECDKVFAQANNVINGKTYTADFLNQLTKCQQLYEHGKINKYDSR